MINSISLEPWELEEIRDQQQLEIDFMRLQTAPKSGQEVQLADGYYRPF